MEHDCSYEYESRSLTGKNTNYYINRTNKNRIIQKIYKLYILKLNASA